MKVNFQQDISQHWICIEYAYEINQLSLAYFISHVTEEFPCMLLCWAGSVMLSVLFSLCFPKFSSILWNSIFLWWFRACCASSLYIDWPLTNIIQNVWHVHPVFTWRTVMRLSVQPKDLCLLSQGSVFFLHPEAQPDNRLTHIQWSCSFTACKKITTSEHRSSLRNLKQILGVVVFDLWVY